MAIRLACVGDSITQGDSAGPGASYPEQLAGLLGDAWVVGNFGVNGATMSRRGDCPYLDQAAARAALSWSPDVVVVLLGTNDSKPHNWQGGEHLQRELRHLVGEFAGLPSKPRVIVGTPISVFPPGNFGITPGVVADVRAAITRETRALGLELVDLSSVLADQPERLSDLVHPDAAGARQMALAIRAALEAR